MPTGIRSDPPWEEFPTRYNHEGDEYIDGLEKVGEKMHRFRDKSKEVNTKKYENNVMVNLCNCSNCTKGIT